MPTVLTAGSHRVLNRFPPGNAGSHPPPSIDYGGNSLQDPRVPYNMANSATGYGLVAWYSSSMPKVTSAAPATAATGNIVTAANPTSGTPMTLRSTTGAGITVLATAFTPWANYTNPIPVGAVAIDGLPGLVAFGTRFRTGFYDPTKGIARCVSVTGVGSGSGGNVLITGADWYGYPMSQLITLAAGANTVNSTKAFKFITSVVPQFTDTHTVAVGTADIFGFNLAADSFADTVVFWNGVLQTLSTFTGAVTTAASTTTGDVRGTFTPGSGSDGTKKLEMFVMPSLARVSQTPMATGLFGVAQA